MLLRSPFGNKGSCVKKTACGGLNHSLIILVCFVFFSKPFIILLCNHFGVLKKIPPTAGSIIFPSFWCVIILLCDDCILKCRMRYELRALVALRGYCIKFFRSWTQISQLHYFLASDASRAERAITRTAKGYAERKGLCGTQRVKGSAT